MVSMTMVLISPIGLDTSHRQSLLLGDDRRDGPNGGKNQTELMSREREVVIT